MKKEITKWITSVEEIAMEEAVNEFFDGSWDPNSWKDTELDVDEYIEEFNEISYEEENLLRSEIKKEFNKKINEFRLEETNQLKDRKSILNWVRNSSVNDWPNEGDVGYMLSEEEILDLILQNGNK